MDRLLPYREILQSCPVDVWPSISKDWFKSLLKEATEMQDELGEKRIGNLGIPKRSDREVLQMIKFAMDEKDRGKINSGNFFAFIAGLLIETDPLEPEGWGELLAKAEALFGPSNRFGSKN